MSRVSTKPQDKRVKTKSSDGSLLLMNPNASCYEESVHTDKQLTIAEAETKDHTAVKSKNRSKSPSFFKLLVGGLRKLSSQEFGDSLPTTSLSDNEEIVSLCIIIVSYVCKYNKQFLIHLLLKCQLLSSPITDEISVIF
jgi:hypothetical protein